MNATGSQNRALAVIGIVAVIMGLLIGLLWAGIGSTAAPTSNNSASDQTTAQATTTPSADDSTIPTVVTSNTGEAATGDSNSASSTPTSTDNSAQSSNSTGDNSDNNTQSSNSSSNNTNNSNQNSPSTSGNQSGSNPAAGDSSAANGTPTTTPTRRAAKRPAAKPKATPSGTPGAGKGAAKGNAGGNTAANGNNVALGGVVDRVDVANNAVLLDTSVGPLTATLSTNASLTRQPVPGDDASAKIGNISLADIQVGSYATVLLTRAQVAQITSSITKNSAPKATPQTTPQATPNAANQKKNVDTLVKRRFGILSDGFSENVTALHIGPAPANIEQSDRARLLTVHATPATFAGFDSDGNLIATITQYGNIKVVVGPGTRYDLLGQPINSSSLKPGDSIMLYGDFAWTGGSQTTMDGSTPAAGKGNGKGLYKGNLPVAAHVAEIHVVTANEHVLQGKVTQVDASANTFQLADATTSETLTVTGAADTRYQSLINGQTVATLSDLSVGSTVVAYTLGDSDIDPKVYTAKTIYVVPTLK